MKSVDVSSKKKGRCGRKQKWDAEKLKEAESILVCDQQTLDRFAICIGITKTSLWRLLQDGKLKATFQCLEANVHQEKQDGATKFLLILSQK